MSAADKKGRARQLSNLGPAVLRLREIAEQSRDSLLTEGPVHPDYELLDLCSTALHHLVRGQKTFEARHAIPWWTVTGEKQKAAIARDDRMLKEWHETTAVASHLLTRIAKLKATTAAGVYAKAMAVRASKTGASFLAMTLAADLLDCPGLRASLWPAGREGETE